MLAMTMKPERQAWEEPEDAVTPGDSRWAAPQVQELGLVTLGPAWERSMFGLRMWSFHAMCAAFGVPLTG
jgi:hypothetical protein